MRVRHTLLAAVSVGVLSSCSGYGLNLGLLDGSPGVDVGGGGPDAAPPDAALVDHLGMDIVVPPTDGGSMDGPVDVLQGDTPDAGMAVDTPPTMDSVVDACAVGESPCSGVCVNFQTDSQHCGSCDMTCGTGGTCVVGACGVCIEGAIRCAGVCANLAIDEANCGRCGRACDPGVACASGACRCPAGTQAGMTGACVVVSIDPTNCGAIGVICRDDQVCAAGTCVCRPGLNDVGGSCSDLQSDPANCGMAGVTCVSGTACVAGACDDPHNCTGARMMVCDGACVNLRTDPQHCGGCGRACSVTELCVSGSCATYTVPASCTDCPCAACSSGGAPCCPAPGGGSIPVCVDTGSGDCP